MARAKKIRPCLMKGRYLGTRSPGRKYSRKGKGVLIPKRCECADPLLSFAAGEQQPFPYDPLRYALNTDPATARKFQTLTEAQFERGPGQKAPPHLVVVPCQETFLHEDSPGTVAYRETRKKSRFRGCFSIEKLLLDLGEVMTELHESTGSVFDVGEEFRYLDHREETKEGHWDNVISSWGSNKNKLESIESIRELEGRFDGILGYYRNPQLQSWVENDIETISANENVRDLYENTKAHKVHLFVASLTKAQREAVDAAYLNNPDQLPLKTIAEKLRISLASIKDRMTGVKKKAVTYFPEYAHLVNPNGTQKKRPPKPKKSYTPAHPIRHTKSDGSVEIVIPTEKNRTPFGPVRPRVSADPSKIRRWLDEQYGVLIPFGGNDRAKEATKPVPVEVVENYVAALAN
jgi:predicted DNA binding protein